MGFIHLIPKIAKLPGAFLGENTFMGGVLFSQIESFSAARFHAGVRTGFSLKRPSAAGKF